MKWFKKADKGHGDTLDGQLLQIELSRISKKLRSLITIARAGGPESVLPRWRGDLRREILTLPAEEKLYSMSMMELKTLKAKIEAIEESMNKYSEKRLGEIVEGD